MYAEDDYQCGIADMRKRTADRRFEEMDDLAAASQTRRQSPGMWEKGMNRCATGAGDSPE
jgi:hypothetical protein